MVAGAGQTFRRSTSSGAHAVRRPPGAATTNIEARIAELHDDGVDRNWPSLTPFWRCSTTRNLELRERVFRIYNEHIAAVQERSNGHFYGVGLINWWDPDVHGAPCRGEAVGAQDVPAAAEPGKGVDGEIIDYGGTAFSPVDEIEAAGLPISHHR